MDEWVLIRYDGKEPMVVEHVRMFPGDVREVSAQRCVAIGKRYPGLFSLVGGGSIATGSGDEFSSPVYIPSPDHNYLTGLGDDDHTQYFLLESLGLSDRVREALEAAGVTRMALERMSDEELLAISGIGKGSLREIRERLELVRVVSEASEMLEEMDDDGIAKE